jgi:hypothetical protein
MTEQTSPSRRAGLRDEIAEAIWERQNPGRRYADCEHPWQADAEADADSVLPVLYRAWPWLRAEAEEATPAEAALARIAALAEEYPVAIDTALIDEALAHAEQPRATASRGADHGPSVADCAADDRAHWTQKYAGE